MAAAVLFCSLGAVAQVGGNTAYNFLDITGSAKIYGLGGLNISLVDPDDVMATDQNPALMGPEMSRGLGIGYMRYVGESNFANAKWIGAAGQNGAYGLGIHYYGYGSVKHALEDGTIVGTFSPSDVCFTGSFSYNLWRNLRGGFNIRFLYSSYHASTALAIATDLGLNWFDEEHDSSLSLTINNLGGQVKKFNDQKDNLPIDVRIGWSKALGNLPLNLSITAWNLTRWKLPYWSGGDGASEPVLKQNFISNLFRHLVFGVEWKPTDRFYVDLGYNYKVKTDMSTYNRNFLSGFSVGAGFNVRGIGVGVAFAQPHKSAATLMLNITTNLYDF